MKANIYLTDRLIHKICFENSFWIFLTELSWIFSWDIILEIGLLWISYFNHLHFNLNFVGHSDVLLIFYHKREILGT